MEPADKNENDPVPDSPESIQPVALLRWLVIRAFRLVILFCLIVSLLVFLFWYICIRMPDGSVVQEAKQRLESEIDADDSLTIPEQLRKHVEHLAETIGERNLQTHSSLNKAADYIEEQFSRTGYSTHRQTFQVNNLDCHNIICEVQGTDSPEEIVIVGAHYDSVAGTPGANDNASGVASMLVIGKLLRSCKPQKTLRLVAFANEEPPYFQNRGEMGSWVYAESCRKSGDNIVAVLSLETMGYYSDVEGSQKYPRPLNLFYPSTGNFIGFVSNVGSSQLQRRVIKVFRDHCDFPSEGASLPSNIPGVGWSDHWSFWQEGYPGIMVTDTAPFRYPHYHLPTDTPDQLDFEKLGKVILGLEFVIKDLLSSDE